MCKRIFKYLTIRYKDNRIYFLHKRLFNDYGFFLYCIHSKRCSVITKLRIIIAKINNLWNKSVLIALDKFKENI